MANLIGGGLALLFCAFASVASSHAATVLYFDGFESNPNTWSGVTQVPNGTDGVPSASGSFHGSPSLNAFTQLGGYNFGAGGGVPTAFQDYSTSLDIYLDVGGSGWTNGTRFDYTSAINDSDGNHVRDFAFNAGFYDDATGPGSANTDRFIIGTSNNTGPNEDPKAKSNPIAIEMTGWYTFRHTFYESGGSLNVDLAVLDSSDVVLGSWMLTSGAPSDPIGDFGGNRYGWFPGTTPGASNLFIDNSQLTLAAAVPEPASLAFCALVAIGMVVGEKRRRRQKEAS
ncbi:hypothetical protein [Allorhodopirellula solitaria]|nr:hypothetical protein [Allorhodopirellula solitaria]